MKSEKFNKEIEYIKNPNYKDSVKLILNKLPDYFYEVPASSTGKYHPEFTLGDGGLVRHTKAAVRIAVELLNNPALNNFNDNEKDLIIISLMIHDGLKSGFEKSEYTKFEHPLLISQFVLDNKVDFKLSDTDAKMISNMVSSHMGPWNTNSYSDVELPKPVDKYQRFVHMCDYLASRKFLNIKFNLNDDIE